MKYFISIVLTGSLTVTGSMMLTSSSKESQAVGTLLMIIGGVGQGTIGKVADDLAERLKEIEQERSRDNQRVD